MTAETQKSKTTRPRKKAKPPAEGFEAVARSLQALSLLPLHALAEGRNQSIPSLLHDLTGLSKARISQGNLDAVRPSTRTKIDRHLERMLQEQFKGNPEELDDLRANIATAPATLSGAPAPLAAWIHQLEFLPWIPLPITKAVALTIDEFLEELLTCCRNDDLQGFKSHLLAHFEHHGLSVRSAGEMAAEPAPEEDLMALQAIADWDQAAAWMPNLVEHLYWDLISSLDAEWNSHYFAGRQTMPLFPLVMVRPQEGLLETMKVASRKNIYFKPVRRLLEFLYALAYYFRKKQWPSRAPTPKELAEILYRPGSDEVAEESLISNYYDGTTKLTQDLVLEHWVQLTEHFLSARIGSERPNPPLPMIMLALQWQTLLVRDKGRSIFIPDMKMYEKLWTHRRKQWRSLQELGANGTGQPMRETINWPVWALNQSSSSS